MQQTKMTAGAPFPPMSWPAVVGGQVEPAAQPGWRMLVVYRGQHCPLCKGYLKTLNDLLPEFETAGVAVAALSADPLEKAKADVEKYGWRFPVGYDRFRRRKPTGHFRSPASSSSTRTAWCRSSTCPMRRSRGQTSGRFSAACNS